MNAVSQDILADAPPVPLIFTDSAASKVKELVDEEGNPELKLRVFVRRPPCVRCPRGRAGRRCR